MRVRRPGPTSLLVVAAAAGGVQAGGASTGVVAVDLALAGAAAALVALAGTRARRWSMFPMAAVGVAFGAPPVGLACAVAALLVAGRANMRRRATPVLGTLVGALGAQALLRLEVSGPLGLETMLGLAAAAPLLISGHRAARRAERRRVRQVSFVVGVTALVVVVAGAVGVTLARTAGDRGTLQVQQALRAARAGDVELAVEKLDRANRSFASAGDALSSWWSIPARAVPALGPNLREVARASRVASDLTDVAAGALSATASDELAVRGGRVPVDAFAGLEAPLLEVERALAEARDRLDRPAHAWEASPIRRRLDRLDDRLAEAESDAHVALDAVQTVPELLGAAGPRRYLVLFVTPVEGRATGFPGNFAELLFTDGNVEMVRFGRVLDLERAARPGTVELEMPPEYDLRYGRFGAADSWRNVTLTPNFPTAAEVARQLYPQTGGAVVDGVLSVDPTALADLLRLTGPVSAPGIRRELTSRNAEEFLLRDQYLELPDTPDRADALESLGRATFEALLARDLAPPQEIARVLSPAFDEQHLRMVSFDPRAAAFLTRVGVTGELPPLQGDFLAVTTNNALGNKIDLFLQRTIDYDARWNPATGEVRSALRIGLENAAPGSGLPDYVIGNALDGDGPPPGTNRTYVSVFSPLGLESATLDGVPIEMESHLEAGRHVYSTFVDLPPEMGTARLELRLAGRVGGLRSGYALDVWPQVLTLADRVTVQAEGPGGMRVELERDGVRAPLRVGE